MHFAQIYRLHYFWLVVLIATFLYWAFLHRQKIINSFVQKELLKHIAPKVLVSRFIYKGVLIVAVFILSIIALARPQWGFEWQEIKRKGVDVLIALDVSRSMLAQDIKPNRLERSKLAIEDVLSKLKGDRIGLIAFAGDAFLACPLTVDYSGFVLTLNETNVDSVPKGGTNVGRAIEEAIKVYKNSSDEQDKSLVIITDGDNLEGDPLNWARKAKEVGIKIYCIGIGSKEGELIQITNEGGNLDFVKDLEGNVVKSRLNEVLLQDIAISTDGMYVKASGAEFGLDLIYDQQLSKLKIQEFEKKMDKKYFDRFQIPLALAVLLLIIETCLRLQS